MDKKIYDSYVAILKHELVPAMGCTEPIAVAYASAKCREVLGSFPEKIVAYLSGNIIKNVKGVTVPNSGDQRGIEVAVILGCVGGKVLEKGHELEVIKDVTEENIATTRRLVKEGGLCEAQLVEGVDNLYICIEMTAGKNKAVVVIEKEHANITRIVKNDEVIFSADDSAAEESAEPAIDKSLLNVHDIIEFANELNVDDLRFELERQFVYNCAISAEGMNNKWGAEVGKELMRMFGDSADGRAAARAAAGSDARMGGCNMPVVINCGSGNQGMTIALPVDEFATAWHKDHDTKLRALALANLIAVHIKRHIGNLSAFCGAVSAGCAAACGVAYMDGCTEEQLGMLITNALCNVGGIVCDGAKSSCAAKIASAVHASLLAYRMACHGRCFVDGEGLVGPGIEKTIQNIGRMGKDGMKSTDIEILNIMIGK